MRTLKMVFDIGGQKTSTLSLAAPKDGLTKAQVVAVGEEMVEKKAILVNGIEASALKDCYIQESNKQVLA